MEPRRHRFRYFSYDQFAGRATVAKFLPLMGERFARQQLRAQAVRGLAGHDPAGQDLDTVRRIRDDVERRVRALLDELHLPVPVGSGQRGPAMRK
ncbi:hypothetical protein [Nakamurella sp.]|uniref:hypothetical protein n=1 Tax=Nakamurella sp. TaxID=1869182 RepID=UPI00378351EE